MPRRSFGKLSASSDMPAGCALASPMPTPSREKASIPKPLAKPASAVITDQPKTEKASSLVRTQPSASRPKRQREDRVEEGEDGAVEQPHLGVADLEIGLDARHQDGEDLAVDHRHGLGQDDQHQGDPGDAAAQSVRIAAGGDGRHQSLNPLGVGLHQLLLVLVRDVEQIVGRAPRPAHIRRGSPSRTSRGRRRGPPG